MRSDDFPPQKTTKDELRILVIGDSVVYDGVQVDQSDICTEVLKRRLTHELRRRVVVGNISAKGWGPPNELAYVRRFGLFDADIIIYVLSSHDYADVPTFEPVVGIDPDYPDHEPLLSSSDLFTRYLPRFLHPLWGRLPQPDISDNPAQKDIQWSLSSERQLIQTVKHLQKTVVLAQMLEQSELEAHPKPGHQMILDIAKSEGVPVIQIGDLFERLAHSGQNPYLDNIHPNRLGCKIMGDSMAVAVERLVTTTNSQSIDAKSQALSRNSM